MKAAGETWGFEWDPLSDMPDTVREVYERGIVVIPQNADRKPAVSWRQFQTRQPTEDEMASWPIKRAETWAVVLGHAHKLIALDLDGEAGRDLRRKYKLKANVKSRSEHGHHVWISGVPVPIKSQTEVQGRPGLTLKGEGGLATFYGDTGLGSYRLLTSQPTLFKALPQDMQKVILAYERTEHDKREELAARAEGGAAGMETAGVCLTRALRWLQEGTRPGWKNRNEAGFNLFCQMRDNRVPQDVAEVFISTWVTAANRIQPKSSEDPYTADDAERSVEQVYEAGAVRDPSVALLLTRPGDEAFEKDVEERLRRLAINEEAGTRFRLEQAREHGYAPPDLDAIPTAEDWFAMDEEDPPWRVSELVQEGFNVILGGKDKAGKTTLAVDLAVSLTNDEEGWLDHFKVAPITGRVGWINCEMTEGQFRKWLRKAGVRPERFAVLNQRGNVPNLLDPVWWQRLADWMLREQVTFLIVDSLTEIIAAAGLDEDKEGVGALSALNLFREKVPVSEILVLAHFGHSGERVRGTSKFGGWVDATLTYVREDKGGLTRRYLSARGRDVDLPEGEVARAGSERLMFQPDISRRANKAASEEVANITKDLENADLREMVLAAVAGKPGLNSTDLRKAVQVAWKKGRDGGLGNGRIDTMRDTLADEGLIRVEGGGRGSGKAKHHYPQEMEEEA